MQKYTEKELSKQTTKLLDSLAQERLERERSHATLTARQETLEKKLDQLTDGMQKLLDHLTVTPPVGES